MKKLIFTLLTFAFWSLSYSQFTDVAANEQLAFINAQLKILNTQMSSLMGTTTSNEINTASSLSESLSQGETLINQYEQMVEVQEDLTKVTNALKSIKSVGMASKYVFNTIKSYRFILTNITAMEINGVRIYSDESINVVTSLCEDIINDNRGLFELVKKLVQNDIFKMEEGNRIKLLLELEEKLKVNYMKVKSFESFIKTNFSNYIIHPIQG